MNPRTLCAATAALLISSAAQASLLGQTINFQRLGLTIDSPQGDSANGNYLVGPGLEVRDAFQNTVALDLSAQQLSFSFGEVRFSSVPFVGVRISDVFAGIDSFTDLSVNDASTVNFAPSRLSFDADHLWVNFANVSFRRGDKLVLDIGFNAASVAEPGSAALLSLGLAALAGAARRQRARKAC